MITIIKSKLNLKKKYGYSRVQEISMVYGTMKYNI